MHMVSALMKKILPNLIKKWGPLSLLIISLASCSSYQPLDQADLYPAPLTPKNNPGVKATFLGNTTILISDGKTNLLVDGFLSRPSALKTLFGFIAPEPKVISRELAFAGITKLDAVLVGHAHHDHALDAPEVSRQMHDAPVMGSKSYSFIHEGAGGKMDKDHLIIVPRDGNCRHFGDFTVTFLRSEHVSSHTFPQRVVEGEITKPLKTPARFSRFNCGEVYVIHIAHPDGTVVVTTTAGARAGQLKGMKADVVFLGVGLLAKETKDKQDSYWQETVGTVHPHTVIPVHWDAFTRKLSNGLKPTPCFADNVKGAMAIVQTKAKKQGCTVRLMNLRDSLLLKGGKLQ